MPDLLTIILIGGLIRVVSDERAAGIPSRLLVSPDRKVMKPFLRLFVSLCILGVIYQGAVAAGVSADDKPALALGFILTAELIRNYLDENKIFLVLTLLPVLGASGNSEPGTSEWMLRACAFAAGIQGFQLLMEGIRYRLAFSMIPRAVQGLPLKLFVTALLSLGLLNWPAFRFFEFGR